MMWCRTGAGRGVHEFRPKTSVGREEKLTDYQLEEYDGEFFDGGFGNMVHSSSSELCSSTILSASLSYESARSLNDAARR